MPSKPRLCGALVRNSSGRVDVCGLEAGHTAMVGEPGALHVGQYRGMRWETFLDKNGRRHNNIVDQGDALPEERTAAGEPLTADQQAAMIEHATAAQVTPEPAKPTAA